MAKPLPIIFLLLVAVFYGLSIFWADWQHHKSVGYSLGIQARYFFPTIVAHMALLIVGITSLGWRPKIRIILKSLLLAVFVWIQLGAIYHFLSIYYDVANTTTLITHLSQYKPLYLKGNWWYLWGSLYSLAIATTIYCTFFSRTKKSPNVHKN